MRKKHLIITAVLFVSITALSLATNFIHWDETPLEQSIFALPLALGMLFEMPFIFVTAFFIGETPLFDNNRELIWTILPFVAGTFYAGLYYFLVSMAKKSKRKI